MGASECVFKIFPTGYVWWNIRGIILYKFEF